MNSVATECQMSVVVVNIRETGEERDEEGTHA